ncbi:MAG: hypothetical protein SPL77_06530, partial [Prevotella sp.]|nr:hypothetical protein [Prevotella sp.]
MKRTITLILMAFMTITMTFAQRSKGEAAVPGSVTSYPDWETYNMDGKNYNYFKGNDRVDTIKVENMLGKHWKGNEVDIIGDQEIYLCNVATGEYLLVGDYWGETSMTNHVGLSYKLLPGTSTRRSEWGGVLPDMGSGTYWIQPTGVREERVIGRASRNDGDAGHFEHNGYLFMRHQVEYEGDQATEHPGGFLFKFEPVTTPDGEQAYIIYTHRKTQVNGSDLKTYEYFNRDSYLMISSVGKSKTADYTKVRFKKFAGQMCGRELVQGSVINYTGTDAYKNSPLGDEVAFYNNGKAFVSLEDGLAAAKADPNNLWKIVTRAQRERYRIVASDK